MSLATPPRTRQEAIAAVLGVVNAHHRFLVTSHARPDGDAIGSSLAAMYFLQALGKEVVVALADPVPRTFARLPGADRIVRTQPAMGAEVALVLECDSVARTGYDHLAAPVTVNIDHHRSGTDFATVNWIDPAAAAVGTLLFELACAAGVAISPPFATCLYAALLTDTVRFTLPNTSAETFLLAHQLLALGADAAGVSEAVYHSFRLPRLRVLGLALERLEVHGAVAWSVIHLQDIAGAGAEVEDCEGIVNHVIGLEDIFAGAFLREVEGGRFRVSLRSKGEVDVAEVAEHLGGGGHRNASGCTVEGALPEVAARLIAALGAACTKGNALPAA